jgi:hypothetical protein
MYNAKNPVRAHFVLSKIWYTAQIFPASKEYERQLFTEISWYMWRGAIWRVPLSTLRRTEEGGLNLIDIAAKCRALFLTRCWAQGERAGSLTVAWLNIRTSLSPRTNSPHTRTRAIPVTVEYLRIYYLELAYMEPQRQAETNRSFTRRVYDTLTTISTAGNRPRGVRFVQLQPAID